MCLRALPYSPFAAEFPALVPSQSCCVLGLVPVLVNDLGQVSLLKLVGDFQSVQVLSDAHYYPVPFRSEMPQMEP